MSYKALIFDLDGTLLDTLEDIGNAMNKVLEQKGFPTHEKDAYRYFVGDGVAMLVKRTLPEEKCDNETIQACLEAFYDYYGRNWDVNTKIYPGIPEMLDALTDRDLRMAILSNKPHEFTKQCTEKFLSNWKFDMIVGQREGAPRKPDPAGALEVAARLNIPPARFLYLGDTAIDMQTAVSAGMLPVGVLWGFRPREELSANGAQVLLNEPLDILTRILL